MDHRVSVLIVDDEESLREPLKTYLSENFGFEVVTKATKEEALEQVKNTEGRYDVALIDEKLYPSYQSPGGIDTMRAIKERYPEIECIIFSGWASDASRHDALQNGAFRYLEKSIDKIELALIIRMAALQTRLRSISKAILTNPSMETMLDYILGAACALALADDAAVVLRDPDTGELHIYHKSGPRPHDWHFHFKECSLTRKIIEKGINEAIPDIEKDTRVDPQFAASGYQSLNGLPIPGEGDNQGVLYIYSRKKDHFNDPGTRTLIKTLASQVGLAVTNIRSFHKVQRHANYMDALVKAAEGLASTNEEEQLFLMAWDFVREYLKVSTFYIALQDQNKQVIHFPFYFDEGVAQSIPDYPINDQNFRNSVSVNVIRTGQEVQWDSAEMRQQVCESNKITPLRNGKISASCFFLPLKIGSEIIGLMSIQSYRPHVFSPFLRDAFRTLGSQLSVALGNSRRFAEVRTRSQKLAEFQEHILSLNAPLTDLHETFAETCKAACEIFQVEHSAFVLFDADFQQGYVEVEYPGTDLTGTPIPLRGVPVEEELLEKHEAQVFEDVETSASLGPVQQILMSKDIRSCVFVPVLDKDSHVIGSFSLDSIGKTHYFDPFEVSLFSILAAHAAVAIQKASAMEELKASNHDLGFLLNINSDLTATDYLNTGLEKLAEDLVNNLRPEKATFAVMLLLDEEQQSLVIRAAFPIRRSSGFYWEPEVDRKGIRLSDLPDSTLDFINSSESVILARTNPEQEKFLDLLSRTLSLTTTAQPGGEEIPSSPIQSVVAIPLHIAQERLGIICLGEMRNRKENHFTKRSLRLADAVGQQASILIDRLEKHEATRRRLEDMHNLRETLQNLIARVSEQPKETLQVITDAAIQVLHADCAIIYPFQPEKISYDVENITSTGLFSPDRNFKEKDRDNFHSMTYQVLQKRIVICNDISLEMDQTGEIFIHKKSSRETPSLLEEEKIQSFVGISLDISGKPYGVLFVNYRKTRHFSDDELDIIRIFADQAAAVVQKSRMFHKLRSSLAKIGESIAQTTDITESLRSIVRGLREVLDCDIVTAYYFDELTRLFPRPAVWDGAMNYPEMMRGTGELLDGKVFSQLILHQKPYYAEDARNDPIMGCGDFTIRENVASSVGAIIWAKGRPVGLLFANYHNKHVFSQTEHEFIETFASMTAVALENSRLLQNQKRLSKLLVSIQQTMLELNYSEMRLDEILNRITRSAAVTFGVPAASLVLYDDARKGFIVRAMFGLSASFQNQFISKTIVDRIIDQIGGYYPYYVRDLRTLPLGYPELIMAEDLFSALALPMVVSGQLIGILCIYSKHEVKEFAEDDQRIGEIFASQAAVAIHNARLYEEATEQKEILSGLHQASAVAASADSLDEILIKIAEQARFLTGKRGERAAFCQIYLKDRRKICFKVAYPRDCVASFKSQDWETIDLDRDKQIGIIGRAAESCQSQLLIDVRDNPDYIMFHPDTSSELAVPIHFAGEVIGVINVEHPAAGNFDSEDQKTLEYLAAQAALSIRNAQMYNELQKRYTELQQIKGFVGSMNALEWMKMVTSHLGHSINTEVGISKAAMALAHFSIEKGDYGSVLQQLDNLDNSLERLKDMPIIAPLSAEDAYTSLSINKTLKKYLASQWNYQQYVEIQQDLSRLQADLDDRVTVRASEGWFRKGIEIVINNAARAMLEVDSPRKFITFTTRLAGDCVEIIIGDTGPGIPPAMLGALFKQPLNKEQGSKGSGLGLLLAKTIFEAFHGAIGILDTGPEGTQVIIHLPVEAVIH